MPYFGPLRSRNVPSIILQAIQFVCILRFVELSNHLSGSGSDVVESLRLSKISLLWYCFPGRREVDLVEYQIWIDENLFKIIELRWRDDGWARKQNIHKDIPWHKKVFSLPRYKISAHAREPGAGWKINWRKISARSTSSIFLISHLLGNIVPKWRLLPSQTQFCSSAVTSFNVNFVNFRLHKTDFLIVSPI